MKSTNVRRGVELSGLTEITRLRIYMNNVEYVVLRLIRRFLLPADLHRWGRYVPFYRTNLAETEPDRICQRYMETLALAKRNVVGKRIVEVGSGATNSAGYALVCAGAAKVWCIEPYVEFNAGEDVILLERLAKRHRLNPAEVSAAVTRCDSFDRVEQASADLIVSHSVLEHVRDLATLLTKMRAALNPTGAMLHIVDYRDHFFKYPLHFLQFSTRTWRRFLDPGDLPRWRLSDHHAALERAGFEVSILLQEQDERELDRIRSRVSADFDILDPTLGVLHAAVYSEHKNLRREQVVV